MEIQQEHNQPNQLAIDDDVRKAILASASENSSYHLGCAFYYLFKNDMVLLSKKQDIWLHKIDTENQQWELTDSTFIKNIFNNHIYQECNKLVTHYESISNETYSPFAQAASTISTLMENLSYYSDDAVAEASDFFSVPDCAGFFANYVEHNNLIKITGQLIDNYIELTP